MERSLSIDVSAINIDFIVIEERNNIMHIGVSDRMEHDVASHLFDLANHNLNNLIINIFRTTTLMYPSIIKLTFLLKCIRTVMLL